ncbi:MAG: hypothetical protein IAE96_05465 [Chitinophagaceae bacterium]|nr:hypothetical protein [Chitinophagaceae bacterium]
MKKNKKPVSRTGIWVDQEQACIVRMEEEKVTRVETLLSGIESRQRFPGEGKAMARFGQSFLDDQEKKQRRQQQQRLQFFHRIIKQLKEVEYVYLFGPGLAKKGLGRLLAKETGKPHLVVATENADKMSPNLMALQVRNFFTGDTFRKWLKNLKREKKALAG